MLLMVSWSSFASSWNQTLNRRPQAMLAAFAAANTTTWLLSYNLVNISIGSVLTVHAALGPGFLFTRLTKKFRQPLNLAIGMHYDCIFFVIFVNYFIGNSI